jgi:hypothetical protein
MQSTHKKYWIYMIIKGIPFRIWERVIRSATGFFFIATIISPFLAHILYLFDADIDYLFTKSSSQKPSELEVTHDHLALKELTILEETNDPFIPAPDIKSHIQFIHYNARPDTDGNNHNTISLACNKKRKHIRQNEPLFLDCSDDARITFSDTPTPYTLTPTRVSKNGLTLSLNTQYKNKNEEVIYNSTKAVHLKKAFKEKTKLANSSKNALESLKSVSFLPPDQLIKLDSSKKFVAQRGLHRLFFKGLDDQKPLFVKAGDKLSYHKNVWVRNLKSTEKKPLLVVQSIQAGKIDAIFYGVGGFFQNNLTIPSFKAQKGNIGSFAFDELYKRNSDSIIAKIDGKTFILKEGDWLIKSESLWKHLTNAQEFDDLLDLKVNHEILICENITEKNKNDTFIGYLFDSTRSKLRKLEIPLKKNSTTRYNR